MRNPVDEVRGKIVDVNENTGEITIKAHYDDWANMAKRGYKECNIRMIDSRPISDKQRKFCYRIINDIAEWSGTGRTIMKEHLKMRFMVDDIGDMGETLFSLSDAPMSLIAAFQKYLVRFCLDFDVPTSFRLIEYVDDVYDFIYACALKKKCCICGQHAELHHCEGSRIGIGGDRKEVIHEGRTVLPLCRGHHSELHSGSEIEWMAKNYIDKGIIADKAICKVYKINAKPEGQDGSK